MALKKPKEVPQIPKARKKKLDALLAAVPQAKPDKIEYLCYPAFKFDAVKRTGYTSLIIETEAEFTSFAYEITHDFYREKNEISVVLLGLKPKTNAIPGVMPASAEIVIEETVGDFTLNVIKQDGCINTMDFNLNIYNKEIAIKKVFLPEKENNRKFCEFFVKPELFEFNSNE